MVPKQHYRLFEDFFDGDDILDEEIIPDTEEDSIQYKLPRY